MRILFSFGSKILLFFILIFAFSCKDVMNNAYSKKTAEGDLERIMAIRRLDSAEYVLMTEYMLKKGLIEPDLMHIDQKYGEILEEAKREKIVSERKKLASNKLVGNKNQFQMDQLEHLYDALIMLPEQSVIQKDWSNKNAVFYKMVFVNPSEKHIKAFKGKFTFYDLFDTELKTINFTYNDSIPARDTITYNANIDFSTTNNNVIYVTKNFSDIKVIWRPTKVLYSDGSFVE